MFRCYLKSPGMRFRFRLGGSVTTILLGLLVASLDAGSSPPTEFSRPNFVVILADDLGYSDLGCYGGEIRTPHLDRLAQEGMQFTQFYNNSKCTESRASLLSGLYYQQTNNLKKGNHLLLPEILAESGYTTLMSGKWHLPRTPLERGFERFFGFLGGAINYYTGRDFSSGQNLMRMNDKPFTPSVDFYSTDAFTDFAIASVKEAKQTEKPFFLYLSYNAPHFPLQVPTEEIKTYQGTFLRGWDRLRIDRHQRLQALDFLQSSGQLSPRDPLVPAWKQLSETQRREEDLLMATYAGMVSRMDTQIGRLINYLEKTGSLENTVVLFMSDNGGCPYRFNRTPDLPPGPAESYRSYDSEWANLSNVPFRLYKQWAHEGGISSPFFIRWPRAIRSNSVTSRVGHLMDIYPTILELAGLSYPSADHLLPLEGESLVRTLKGDSTVRSKPLFWEFRGHHSVRRGDWKLVAESGGNWELYNMSSDRVESKNLSDQQPERVSSMEALYEEWANRVGALTHDECLQKGVSTQSR